MIFLGSAITGVLSFLSRQHKAFKVNIMKNVLVNFSLGLTEQYQSIFVTSLGASALELGFATGVGGVACMLLSIPVGLMADRFGIKRMMAAFLFLYAVGFGVFGSASSWQVTAAGFVLVSLGTLISSNVCPMVCGSCLASVERTTGMQFCDTVTALPRLFAPLAAAVVITYFGGLNASGIRPLFWIQVGLVIFALLVIQRLFENPAVASSEERSFTAGIRRVLSEGVNTRRWIVYYCLMTFPWFMGFYIPLFAQSFRGANQFVLGLMGSGYWLAVVLLSLPVGIAADRMGRRRLIALLSPLYCLGMVLLATYGGNIVLVLVGILNGFTMLMGVTESSITVELVPKDLLGSWFGLLGFFTGLVSFITPVLGGLIWNSFNPVYVLYFLVATQLLKLTILATMPSKTKYS